MTPRRPRVAVAPEAMRIGRALAALEGKDFSDWLSDMLVSMAPRVADGLRHVEPIPGVPNAVAVSGAIIRVVPDSSKQLETQKPEKPAATPNPIRKVSAPLSRQPEKIAHLKEIWASGERNQAEISRQIGAKEDSVNRWIAKHKEELK